jgi:hypothetical protein
MTAWDKSKIRICQNYQPPFQKRKSCSGYQSSASFVSAESQSLGLSKTLETACHPEMYRLALLVI